ncbi:MAG: SanA protein [Cyclobacteriaceae bacterium]
MNNNYSSKGILKHFNKIWKLLVYGTITFLVVCNFWIINSTSQLIYEEIVDVPVNEVALVLGTSKYKMGGGDNLFFANRIKAAAELYHAQKVKKIILSGTRSSKYYDEPKEMKAALLALKIPESVIVIDNEGFRTLNSIVNAKVKYDRFTLITQRYHAYRALFISSHLDVDAICYEADFPSEDYSYTTVLREVFARPKAILDLYVLK